MLTSQSVKLFNSRKTITTEQPKLIILPGTVHGLGGAIISLVSLLKGLENLGQLEQVCVMIYADSLMEKALVKAGLACCLVRISATTTPQYLRRALRWILQQPNDWPLLLENCSQRQALLPMMLYCFPLNLQRRPIYLMFRDLASSYHPLGGIARKLTFMSLNVKAICNSQFTAQTISQRYVHDVKGVLLPSVDLNKFSTQTSQSPPPLLQPILRTGKRLMLTVSRITRPNMVNDKNLRIIPAILAELKRQGHDYYGVIVGQDSSPDQEYSQVLTKIAQDLGVDNRFQILPPDFQIEAYYQHADVLVTLAPREPFGRTVVEAIACGLPVVGSNTGGISEILSNFAPEWTVDAFDATAAANAVIRLTNDPNIPAKLVQGQAWIRECCSVDNTARTLMNIVGLTGEENNG